MKQVIGFQACCLDFTLAALWLIMLLSSMVLVEAWTRWNYTVQWNAKTAASAAASETSWYLSWNNVSSPGRTRIQKNARPRRGHSLDFFVSNSTGDLGSHTYIVMFGGRDNENPTSDIFLKLMMSRGGMVY